MNNGDDKTFDDELDELAAKLPQGVSPGHDLWPGIEQAINQPAYGHASIWAGNWAKAAAVVLLVAGSSGITYFTVKDGGPAGQGMIVPDGYVFETVSGDFGQHYTLGNEYLDARRQLAGSLEEKLQALPPETRSAVVENLGTIRVAIKDINKALAAEPDNTLLQELLLRSYHDEISLMKKVDGIANAAMLRDDI